MDEADLQTGFASSVGIVLVLWHLTAIQHPELHLLKLIIVVHFNYSYCRELFLASGDLEGSSPQ